MKLSLCILLTVLTCLVLVEGWEPAPGGPEMPLRKTDVCSMPKVVGPCKASFRRWFFDAASGKCQEFIYGGCKGNGNNFESKRQCEKQCGSWKPTPCPGVPPGKPDVCRMPKEPGPCKAAFTRFYFDSKTRKCRQFTYGGCQGNGNNFESKRECEKQCGSHHGWKPIPEKLTKKPVACSMPAVVGLCKAALPRFYFNSTVGKCLPFKYGGCGGNANNFVYKNECEKKCGKKYNRQNDPCLKSAKGIALLWKENTASALWYYDTKSEKCTMSKRDKAARNLTPFTSCSSCVKTCRTHMHKIQTCPKENLPE